MEAYEESATVATKGSGRILIIVASVIALALIVAVGALLSHHSNVKKAERETAAFGPIQMINDANKTGSEEMYRAAFADPDNPYMVTNSGTGERVLYNYSIII